MKTLFLIRHASAENYQSAQTDLNRSLTEEGMDEAAIIAGRLKGSQLLLDAVVASPALRTRMTAQIYQQIFNIKQDINIENNLYEAAPREYEQVITSFNNSWSNVAVFGHNPGITQFVNSIEIIQVHMSPAAAFVVRADVENWNDFMSSDKRLVTFESI